MNIFIRYWERCDALEHTDVKEPTRLPAEPQRPSKDSFQRTHSVFISYGQPDHAVAEKVNAALRRFGIKTFFFPENSPAGLKLHKLMRDGVNSHDRILLVCSEHSLNRKGVLNEIEETLQREARDGGATYLIPLMLDDFVLTRWSPPDPGMLTAVRDRVIADFRGADENEATFESAVRRLVEVLVFTDDRSEIGAAAEGTGHVPAEAILQDFEVGATNATDAGAQIHFREELGDAPEIFAHATKLYERGTRVMATHIVRSLAWRGFPPAQAMLGDLYQSGNSLQRDFERASRWYMLSAHRGNADAQFELAQLISSGKVRGGTEAHVERLYERAASQGHEGAEFCIAELAYRRAYYDQALKLLETIHSNTSHRYWCEAVSILRTMYWRGEGVEQNATYVRHLKYEGVMQGCWEGGTDG
ncbi:MAG TPA: toll/interleukin-1 receptor domain-containing protein [Polyangiaceae bacterium]|nr:toll/interleukin-1 receptor domain-containing protein [Polyangiaceae bacterium]